MKLNQKNGGIKVKYRRSWKWRSEGGATKTGMLEEDVVNGCLRWVAVCFVLWKSRIQKTNSKSKIKKVKCRQKNMGGWEKENER